MSAIKTLMEFKSRFNVVMNDSIHFAATIGIEKDNEGLKNGMEWLFTEMAKMDCREVEQNKKNLVKQRRFANLTREQKI